MELWIRSQDKLMLTKIDYLYLEAMQNKEILGGNHYMISKSLGTYKTKERALEVLDEIQNIIKPKVLLTRLGKVVGETCDGTVYSEPNEYEMQELSTAVYEMPKE